MSEKIPPCPKCERSNNHTYGCICALQEYYTDAAWRYVCRMELGRALSETHGIHTLAELDKRLAPAYLLDGEGNVLGTVRVAPVIEILSRLDQYGNSIDPKHMVASLRLLLGIG